MVIFMGLLNDLFPGVDPPRKRDLAFERVIAEVTRELGLTVDDEFVLRVVQLSELLAIRHCVFLMGPTGSGRSEVYRVRWRQPCKHVPAHVSASCGGAATGRQRAMRVRRCWRVPSPRAAMTQSMITCA